MAVMTLEIGLSVFSHHQREDGLISHQLGQSYDIIFPPIQGGATYIY